MKQFNVEIKRSITNEPLPAGGYVAKILNAKVDEYSWGEVLVISFDIAEGDYKDFFAKQYQANTNEDKKWKGNFRLTVPQESNQYFESQKRAFGNALACIEESNSGYHWNWNEAELKGKLVGVLFRNKEWEMNEKTGWTTEACTFVSVDEIRTNTYKMPKDKPLANKPTQNNNVSEADLSKYYEEFSSAVELPFN